MIEIKAQNYCPTYTVFLAGGISDCPDWQKEAVKLLKEECAPFCNLVVYNPRQDVYRDNEEVAKKQIEWEDWALCHADAVIFWFPNQTLCPITLYELGKMANTDKPIFVGCDKDYKRYFDVFNQLSLIRPEVKFRTNLRHIVIDFRDFCIGIEPTRK